MMAVQLPEPDYYTLEEVAQRWGMNQDQLLRLGMEEKINIAFEVRNAMSLLSLNSGADSHLLVEVAQLLGLPDGSPPESECVTSVRFDGIAHLHPSALRGLLLLKGPSIHAVDVLLTGVSLYDPKRASQSKKLIKIPRQLTLLLLNDAPLSKDKLIILTDEITRIERQHEVASQAHAEEALNTKEKEKLQAIIAAMAQIVAERAPAYKRGDAPNASQIADLICQTGLVDRKQETIAKEISNAWKIAGRR
ncbi:hypothetical protein JKG47_12100 [Acidithiobacillus sp. MC6.1]|nr:hypothetical protein [Acidithiobacillus sp. MC6.1]